MTNDDKKQLAAGILTLAIIIAWGASGFFWARSAWIAGTAGPPDSANWNNYLAAVSACVASALSLVAQLPTTYAIVKHSLNRPNGTAILPPTH